MRGIDVYQGEGTNHRLPLKSIPAQAYKESDFVIVKSTQGVSYSHTKFFYEMIEKTLKDGKLGGAYHYAAGHDPIEEAEYFLKIVKDYIGKIILCLDWESYQNSKWGSKTWCKKFIDHVKKKTGVTCFLYTGEDGCIQNKGLAGKVPLWFARYPKPMRLGWDVPKLNYDLGVWKKYDIWQYTSSKEKIDRNTTKLTKEQWLQYAKGEKISTDTKEKKESKDVNPAIKKTADLMLMQARSWLGRKESDGSHKKIIDLYNAYKPLPRNYKVKYTDPWCATFVSACGIACNYTDIIPIECSCNHMIELGKKMGIWVENENRVPNPGDILFYDWQDSGKGDNKGSSDHVGIVEKVVGKVITVIEGNYKDSVKRRTINVNGKFIRGYITPKYETLKKAYTGKYPALPPRGWYKLGDGYRNYKSYSDHIVKLQKLLNWILVEKLEEDGKYGPKTEAAVKKVQKLFGIKQDGEFGEITLSKCRLYKK